MQGWYESGYFFDGLPMKRNDIDADFETLQSFKRRIVPPGTAETLFLSHISPKTPPAPPGLVPQPNSTLSSVSVPTPIDRYFAADINQASVNQNSYPPANNSGYLGGLDQLPSGYSLHALGPISDAERARREREDFLRSLREREMASNTPDHVLGANVSADMSSFGLGMGNVAPNQRPVNGAFRPGNAGVATLQPNLAALSPVAMFGQQPFQQITSPTYTQNSAYDTMNAHSSILGQTPVWGHPTAVGIEDRGSGYGIRSGSAQASSSPSPWQTVIDTSNNTAWNQQPLADVNDHFQSTLPTFSEPPQLSAPTTSIDQAHIINTQQFTHEMGYLEPESVDELTSEVQELAVNDDLPVPATGSSPSANAITTSPSEPTVPSEESNVSDVPVINAAPVPVKPVWSTTDEKSTTAISLRKIQEAEAKKVAEARKAEKDRLARLAATATATAGSSPSSVTSPLDTAGSWGLPQVGRAAPVNPSPSGGATAASVVGAWATRAAQPAKKTMKEIQEEEAKRKKEPALSGPPSSREGSAPVVTAPPASTSSTSTKRGYADSAKVSVRWLCDAVMKIDSICRCQQLTQPLARQVVGRLLEQAAKSWALPVQPL